MFAEFWCSLKEWDIVEKINDSEESKVLAIIKGIALTKRDLLKLTLPIDQGSLISKWLDEKVSNIFIIYMVT
jgi:hypothetical protein